MLTSGLSLLASIFATQTLWAWYQEFRSRHWPIISAIIVEVPPGSLLEGPWGWKIWNIDTDHRVQWEVEGRRYSALIEDQANASIGMLKIWRRVPSGSRELKYDPADPSRHWMLDRKGSWRAGLFFTAVVAIGALASRAA